MCCVQESKKIDNKNQTLEEIPPPTLSLDEFLYMQDNDLEELTHEKQIFYFKKFTAKHQGFYASNTFIPLQTFLPTDDNLLRRCILIC